MSRRSPTSSPSKKRVTSRSGSNTAHPLAQAFEAAFVLLASTATLIVIDVGVFLQQRDSADFFVGPKGWTMLTLGAVALAWWAVTGWRRIPSHALRSGVRDGRILALLASMVLFLLAPFLATVTPLDAAFLGSTQRADGALLMLVSLLLAATLAMMVHGNPCLRWIAIFSFATAASIAGTFGIFESNGTSPFAWFGGQFTGRIEPRGTIGNAAFLGVTTAMASTILVSLALSPRIRRNPRQVLLLALWAIFLAFATASTGGRAAYLALLATLLGMAILTALRAGGARARLITAGAALLLIVSLVAGTALTDIGRQSVRELRDALQGTDNSWNSRLVTFTLGAEAIAQQPLRPYGPAAFGIVVWDLANEAQTRQLYSELVPWSVLDQVERRGTLIRYPDPRTGEFIVERAMYDKAHNYLLDLTLSFGLLATLALVTFVLLVIASAIRSTSPVAHALAATTLIYAIHAQAWFPAVATEPAVFALLGVAWGLSLRASPQSGDSSAAPQVEQA